MCFPYRGISSRASRRKVDMRIRDVSVWMKAVVVTAGVGLSGVGSPISAQLVGPTAPAVAGSTASLDLGDGLELGILETAGTGDDTAYLVVDFDATGGHTYAWAFDFDASDGLNVLDLLIGVTDATDLDFSFTVDPTFGAFINNFTLPPFSEAGDPNNFWQFFDGEVGAGTIDWTSSSVGVSSAPLEDGSIVGWFNGFTPGVRPTVPVIPEPAGMALLGLGLGALAMRRRARRDATRFASLALVISAGTLAVQPAAADPFADTVVSYDPGTGFDARFTDSSAALGSPTRFTSPSSPFGGAVTPFQAAFGTDEIVTIGEGGSLVVWFDEPVTDDASNPFGIDLLIFGNSFAGLNFSNNTATGDVFGEGGVIAVSANGVDFVTVPGVDADGSPFPTLGYQDVTEPFPGDPGFVPTSFTKPVDPSLDLTGLSTAQIAAAYDGSGGGVGIDLATVGLDSIQFVRISNPIGSGVTPEIDGFANVPEPGVVACLALGVATLVSRRRPA
ncbi:MAG: PEP-CTERM sorting domain-containing protein [Planctomycetota bacterium]